MPNASTKVEVEKLKKLERRTRADELRDLGKFVLNSRAGRAYLWELMEFAGVRELSYTRGDALETCFREGGRNIGNKILADIVDCSPDLYSIMVKENTEEMNARTDSNAGSAEGSDASGGTDEG